MLSGLPNISPSEPVTDYRKTLRRQQDLQLLQRLHQRDVELEAARHICEALFQHVDLGKLVEETLHTALEVVGAEAGSILLADSESKQLVFRYSIGAKPVPAGTMFPSDQGIAGAVFESGEPQVISDVKQDPRHFAGIDAVTGYMTRDMISLPLRRLEGKPIGVLNVLNKRDGRLCKDDLAILTLVSGFAAIAIEQARLYEERKLAEVARLLGDISHDLKNLLMPFITGVGLLRKEIEDLFASLPSDAAAKGRASGESCNEVVDMLFDAANQIKYRMQAIADCVKGRSAPPQFATCKIAGVMDSVMRTLRVLAEEKGVTLCAAGLDEVPDIVADDHRLFNAFYNLVNNALAEVPTGGSVMVRGHVECAKEMVLLSVADTGPGMTPEVRESLFTSRAISRKPGGTGLGIKIVKDVVDAHHGQIDVESVEGSGTTFVIRLPLHQPNTMNNERCGEVV